MKKKKVDQHSPTNKMNLSLKKKRRRWIL